jgi:hypothetical protein
MNPLAKRYGRGVRYGVFLSGLLLAGASFLLYLGNALAMEGSSESLEWAGIVGMIVGSIIAAAGLGGRMTRDQRHGPPVRILAAGLVGGVGGWLLGSLLFPGGRYPLEWMLAVCFVPLGMWLGALTQPRGSESRSADRNSSDRRAD